MGETMKVIIYGDPQIKNHPEFSSVDKRGLSNWIMVGKNCFRQMVDYAEEHKITWFIGLGDMCETKNYVDNSILCSIEEILREIQNINIHHEWVIGNHDFSNPHFPIQRIFYNYFNNIHDTLSSCTQEPNFSYLPWMQDQNLYVEQLKEAKGDYLFTHNTIVPIDLGSLELPGLFNIKDMNLKKFKLIFSGHIHKPQQVGNVIYVGSMFQTDFGEEGEQKRFVVLDIETGTFESIDFKYPRLINIIGMEINKDIKDCYVKFKIEVPDKGFLINRNELKEQAMKVGALGVKIEIIKTKQEKKVRLSSEQIKTKTLKDFVGDYCVEKKENGEIIWSYVEKLLKGNN